jgi:hypothetical protein
LYPEKQPRSSTRTDNTGLAGQITSLQTLYMTRIFGSATFQTFTSSLPRVLAQNWGYNNLWFWNQQHLRKSIWCLCECPLQFLLKQVQIQYLPSHIQDAHCSLFMCRFSFHVNRTRLLLSNLNHNRSPCNKTAVLFSITKYSRFMRLILNTLHNYKATHSFTKLIRKDAHLRFR